MKSIMDKKDGTCYLCRKLNKDYSLKLTQEHHCLYGGTSGNRKQAEKYGLKVNLCIPHHLAGHELAVHQNEWISDYLKKDAQRVFTGYYPNLDFRTIFGKNYLEEKELNKVILMGRLTRDPEVRYSQGENPIAIARYTMAVDRRRASDQEQSADFISCIAFGKNGEFAEKYLKKGTKIVAEGRIQTGSYTNKDGQKVYTTDVVVESQEFAESKGSSSQDREARDNAAMEAAGVGEGFMSIPDGIEEELPFN